ncbi:MAG: autotransporter-associated beta strand repeat-containing protein [Gemmatales bacterium]
MCATLRLQNAGTLSGANSITVSNGAGLTITQPATAVTGRLGTAPITLHSGRFNYNTNTNSNVAIVENMGTVSGTGLMVFSGSSTAGPTAGTTLNFGNLTRTDNATLFFRGPATGTGAIGGAPGTGPVNYFFANLVPDTSSSGTTRSVVPFAASINSTGGSFATGLMTYDANGFRPLVAAEMSIVTTPAGLNASTGLNVDLNGGFAVAGNVTVNSISSTTGTPSLTGAGTITITSGALQHFNAFTLNGPVVNFGSNTGYIYQGDVFTVTGGVSEIQGTAGVVFNQLSTSFNGVVFSNTLGNSFSGGLTVNGNAIISFNNNNQLGRDVSGLINSGQITLGGGQLLLNVASTVSLNDGANNRNIVVNRSNGTIGTRVAAGVLQIPGTISGAGQVQFGGGFFNSATGVVELTGGANTYTGGTLISTGILRISNSNQLSTGPVLLNAGNLQASANLNFSNPITVTASSTIDTQANNIVLAGGLNGSGGTAGTSALSIAITKNGLGTLNITGAGNFASGITLPALAGTLTLDGNGRLPELGAVSIGRGGIFNIDNSVTNISDRTGRATNLTLTNNGTTGGATLNLTTNAAGSTNTFGSLTVSGGVAANVNTSTINLIDGGTGNNTITFTSLTAIAANNILNFVGTTNFGQSVATGTHLFFQTAPTLTGGVIANANFTGFGGTGQATYDATYGVVLFVAPVNASGTVIDNIGAPQLTTNTNFTTTGDTTAKTGARLNSLTLDVGNNLNLVQTYAAAPGNGGGTGNGNTAIDTLLLSSGSLTVTAAGPKTVTATTTGVLAFGASNAAVVANSDLTIAASVGLQGTGGLAKSGAGTMTVNGPNNLGGDYNLSVGNLTLNTNATGVGSLTSAAATTLTIGAGATVTSTTAASTALAGTLAGSGNIIKAGAGTLTISGSNAGYTGNVTVTGGNVQVANLTTALGSGAAILNLNGGGLNYTGATVALTSAQTPVVGAAGGTINVTTAATTITMGNNTWYGGNLTKTGTGTLQMQAAGNITTASNLTITNGTFDTNGNNLSIGALTFGDSSATQPKLLSGAGVVTLGGNVNFNPGAVVTQNITTNFNLGGAVRQFVGNGFTSATLTDYNISGVISGTGGITLVPGASANNSWYAFTGANTFNGTLTNNSGGGVLLGAVNTLPTTTAVSQPTGNALFLSTTVAEGGVTVGSFNQSIGSLSGVAAALAILGNANLTTGNDNSDTTYAGVISNTGGNVTAGTGSLTKVGSGKFTLSGANTYTGPTNVNGGKLIVNGSITSNVTVAAGATLGGSGTITGSVTVNGNVSPGNSPGKLSLSGSISLADNSSYVVELASFTGGSPPTAGTDYDQIALTSLTGTYTIGNNVTLSGVRLSGFVAPFLSAWTILSNANTTANSGTGTFAGLNDGDFFAFDGQTFQIRYNVGTFSVDATNGLQTLTAGGAIVIAAVPEPATIALMIASGVGAVGLVGYRRWRSKKNRFARAK